MAATVSNPTEALEAHRAIQRLSVGKRTRLDVDATLNHVERQEPLSTELPDGYAWYLPALAYTFVRMDRSIFKLFATEVGGIVVPTFLSEKPLLGVRGVNPVSEWYQIIQGVPLSLAQSFEDFIGVFAVNSPRNGVQYRFELGDGQVLGVPARVLLPRTPDGAFRVDEQTGVVYYAAG